MKIIKQTIITLGLACGMTAAALKQVVKLNRKVISEEHKQTVNAYLNALGDLPLFATPMVN